MKRLSFFPFFLTLTILASCSHVTTGSWETRIPSSEQASVNGSATFEHILNSPDPRARARAYVGRLLAIRIRAASWLTELDASFERAQGKSLNLVELPVYRKLLATRSLVERLEHKVANVYAEAKDVAESGEPSTDGRNERAAALVAGVHDALKEVRKSKAHRVLLHDFLLTIKETIEARNTSLVREASSDPLLEPISPEDISQVAAESADQIQQMAQQLPERDDAVNDVEREQASMSFDGVGDGRIPQSANIVPSMGPNGNIIGSAFPVGTWALTFDDGPHPTHTLNDLAVLQKQGVKATFFWLAQNVQRYPAVVKQVKDAGMPLENHSWSHAKLSDPNDLRKNNTSLDREINQSTAAESQAYGSHPRFFRCPYGAGMNNPNVRSLIVKNAMVHVFWNVDSLDWQDKNPNSVAQRVMTQMASVKRGVILFHDIHPQSTIAVNQVLTQKKNSGRWVTIPQIVDELNNAH